jgi:hypothetical protein
MASTNSSLVLGFSARLPPQLIEPFVQSLRATEYRGQLGLVLAHYKPEDYRRLSKMADLAMSADGYYNRPNRLLQEILRFLRQTRFLRRLYPTAFRIAAELTLERTSQRHWEALEFHLEGLQSLRYSLYYDFLINLAPTATEILVTDVRDVLFQGDPFSRPLNGLEVALEPPCHTFAREPFNRRWILDLAGPDQLIKMNGCVASCSGTVIGPRADMLHYLREMSAAIGWRRCAMGPHDQAIHNLLLHTGRLPKARVIPNGHGRILTMGGMSSYDMDTNGHVTNFDGSLPAVVHQYDRHPGLADVLHRVTRAR